MFSAMGTRASFLRPRDNLFPLWSDRQTSSSCSSLHSQRKALDDEKSLCTSEYSDDNFHTQNYGSIFLQLQEANEESEDIYEFLDRAFGVVWNSLAMTFILVILLGLPISMIAVGSSYRQECPKEPKVPLYLLIGGVCGAVQVLILIWRQKKSRDMDGIDAYSDDEYDDAVMARSIRFTCYVMSVGLVTWFAIGNLWFFSIWMPNFKQPLHEPSNWCNETAYMFTFYQILFCYSLILVVVVFFLIMSLVYAARNCGQKR